MNGIKAIETKYKGYRFRSRLEARYAIYFDYLSVRWEYEHEGYVLSDGSRYLPDFWFPTLLGGSWAEVKPDDGKNIQNTDWYEKVAQFVVEKQTKLWACVGSPSERIAILHACQVYTEHSKIETKCLWLDDYLARVFQKQSLIQASIVARSARFEHGENGEYHG